PLTLAILTERWGGRARSVRVLISGLGWLPVPMLALVIFLVAASQVETIQDSIPVLGKILLTVSLFLLAAVLCSILLGRLFALPVRQTRTLLFTFSTRNSFVVLPF